MDLEDLDLELQWEGKIIFMEEIDIIKIKTKIKKMEMIHLRKVLILKLHIMNLN
jgi:hypothetical protein